jgi:hypothetical protein
MIAIDRRLAVLSSLYVIATCVTACGSNSSPTAATNPQVGTIAVSNFVASVQGPAGNLTYNMSMHLTETSGKVGVNVTSFNFNLANGLSGSTNHAVRVPAGGAADTPTFNLTDTSGRDVATQVSVTVAYTDDGGHSGSANGSASITTIHLVTLSGIISDASTGKPVGGATIRATTGANSGISATSDSGGHYALTPLAAGSFSIQVSAAGFRTLSQSVAIDRDTTFNIGLTPIPPDVEYRITGSARRCSATYENSTGGTNQSEVNIPFSYSWSGARIGDFLYMSCQIDTPGDGGNIVVTIYKNGTLYKSAEAVGFPNIATASGSY